MLQPTQKAPLDIKVLDHNNQETSLNTLLGNYVVLYFYPKDNTPGCTQEACSFRDFNAEIAKLEVKIIGISKDSHASHQKFSEKHQLNYPLWSDPDHRLLEAFGAWGEKKLMGKLFMGIIRSTFVIDPQGIVVKTWEKVKPENHAEEVLEFLKKKIAK